MRPRCTELVEVKYDNSNFNIINETKVILAKGTMTNNEDFDKPWTLSYSSDESETERPVPFKSYAFERTEGHEMFSR